MANKLPNGKPLPYSYYKTEAQTIHTRFVESLRLLREVTAPEAVKMCVDDLQEIFTAADKLHRLDLLHPIDAVRLQHILARDVAQHVAIVRSHRTNLITDDRYGKTTQLPS